MGRKSANSVILLSHKLADKHSDYIRTITRTGYIDTNWYNSIKARFGEHRPNLKAQITQEAP